MAETGWETALCMKKMVTFGQSFKAKVEKYGGRPAGEILSHKLKPCFAKPLDRGQSVHGTATIFDTI